MKLLILESQGKVKKVQSFLGDDWKVVASFGHVRDLPEKELGVSLTSFVPNYIPTKRGKGVLKKIQSMAKSATEVYLATDPDREGEAIAWHIADELHLPFPKRITYGEITASAIKAAIASPRKLDMPLVKAQEARRVLDRLCGYLVSSPLSNAANNRLSAGRVQSPALRLVVEREKAINAFVSTTYYGAELSFEDGYKATWLTHGWHEGEYLQGQALAGRAANVRSLVVQECKEAQKHVSPPPPFITSSLQQAASNAFGFTPKHTMSIAQKLYEQGHITYMRTDSPNLSLEAIEEIRSFCSAQGWSVVKTPRTWKAKQNAQEAHEAIRPTHCIMANAGESPDEKLLYNLIRTRTLASQLVDAIYDVRILFLRGELDGKAIIFEAKGHVLREVGWKVITQKDVATQDKDTDDDACDNPVPSLSMNSNLVAQSGAVLTKKTKAPIRFSEASLIRELEKRGIGRPATFAAILDTILQRSYVRTEKKYLVPTPLGTQVIDLLGGAFSFVDYSYTRTMEESLDAIATNKMSYQDVMMNAHDVLKKELGAFVEKHPHSVRRPSQVTDFTCTICGKHLVHLEGERKDGKGRYDFFACSDRSCNTNYDNQDGKPSEAKKKPILSKHKCLACFKPLIQRDSAKGVFFGCSGYPECKKTYKIADDGSPKYGGKK